MTSMIATPHNLKGDRIIALVVFLQIFCCALALLSDQLAIAFIPLIVVAGLWVITDIRILYYCFALVIPFSVEVELPGGLGTDLPSEPLMWAITGLGFIYVISKPKLVADTKWLHPISLLIIAHLLWIGFTAFVSQVPLISLKFFLAKVWYIFPFFWLFSVIYNDKKSIYLFFKILVLSLSIAITIVMVRHSVSGFSFKSINEAVHPIFRNHVNYAVILIALMPYVFALFLKEEKKWFWLSILFYFIAAIYLSYTRAAMIALFLGVAMFFIVRFKFVKPAICATIITLACAIPYLLHNNTYLDYTPDYEKAIAHYKFDNLIEATYKLEDISTMERLYRWVAGMEMIKEKPLVGFGPNSFYPFYQDYSISEFQTYVSDNPEKSGIHNYYLMTVVEQGVFGGIIFLLLTIAGVIYGEKAYHKLLEKEEKILVMTATISLLIISSIILINDLIEADKVGPFYFIALAIIFVFHNKSNVRINES